jgi:hypothetical protein
MKFTATATAFAALAKLVLAQGTLVSSSLQASQCTYIYQVSGCSQFINTPASVVQ